MGTRRIAVAPRPIMEKRLANGMPSAHIVAINGS
jgi:hypothetical protein